MTSSAERTTAIDVFCGAGGLSLGAKKSGFEIVVGVDICKAAAATFQENNPDAFVLNRDVRKVTGRELLRGAGTKGISLLMGCAPCQGFSSLTRKSKKRDPRNQLLLEMARLIEEIQPETVMMENVPGLLTTGKSVFSKFLSRLRSSGYKPQFKMIQMANYGVPQYRRRVVLLAGKGFEIPFPSATHARIPKEDSDINKWVSVRQAIRHLTAPTRFSRAVKDGGPQLVDWHVVRDLHQHTRATLRAARPGNTWLELGEALRPKCHREGYEGFTNTYGRIEWDKISPTITAGCTTPAKGRFGHPDGRRYTISVREAAILQSFPEDYPFVTDQMDKVCELVGNAVPPRFAQAAARQISVSLEMRHDNRMATNSEL